MLLCALFVFPCATIGYASNGGAETELVSATKKEKKKKAPKSMSKRQWEKRKKKAAKKGGGMTPTMIPLKSNGGSPVKMLSKGEPMGYDQFIKKPGIKTVKSTFITLHKVDGKVYFEFPKKYLGREMLIAATVTESSDPELLMVGYKNQKPMHVKFEILDGAVYMRSVNARVMADPSESKMQSAADKNFIDPLESRFRIEAYNRDSSAVIFDMTSLFMGKEKALNPVPKQVGQYGITSQPQSNLSFLGDIKAFDDNLSIETCMTYDFTLKYAMFSMPIGNMTAKITNSVLLLPEKKMKPRVSDTRLGVFLTNKEYLSSKKDGIQPFTYANRWRVEPKDMEAWGKGELVEPVKPIVWYVDTLFPDLWLESIKNAVLKWNLAFEKIGLKNVIQVKEFPKNDPNFDPDNLKYSCIRYLPVAVSNAMGPSWVDPTTGEIINATVIVYNDIIKLINNWRFTQTAQIDPRVRTKKMPDDIVKETMTYVISHEIGHTLGLMHNMAASHAYPVDSLRSATFTQKYGTTPSIMDYARFNYVAQPGDEGVRLTPPELGVYDYFIIKWLYSPISGNLSVNEEAKILERWVDEKAGDPLYRYGRQQTQARYDPSAIEEDLGDNAMKAGDYGIKNLKYILKHLSEWLQDDPDFSHRSSLYGNIANQYLRYISNAAYNVGGIYLTAVKEGTKGKTYEAVPREVQKEAMQWVIRQMRNCDWVDDRSVLDNVGLNIGMASYIRQSVMSMLINLSANVVLSSYISDKPYSVANYFDDLYNGIWESTIKGRALTAGDRQIQRLAVASTVETVKAMTSGDRRRICLTNVYTPSVDEIVLYGLDESGIVAKYLDEFRKFEWEEGRGSVMSEMVKFGSGYGSQAPIDITAIDERTGFYYNMLEKVTRLVKSRVNTANAMDKAHYQSILVMLEAAKK